MSLDNITTTAPLANGMPLPSAILPKSFLRTRYSSDQQRLRKLVKNGLLSSIVISDSNVNEDLSLSFRLIDAVDRDTRGIVLQCEYGKLKLYNCALFLQTLSGFMIDANCRGSSDSRSTNELQDSELVSLAVARLPKSFTDIFGFLAFTSKDISRVETVNPDETETEPTLLTSFASKNAQSDKLNDAQGDDFDAEPVYETAPQIDTSEQHCMSVRLSGKNVSLHCVMEADAQCWLNILNHKALQSSRVGSKTSTYFKSRIACVVGKVALNATMINQLCEGDILLLDDSYIDDSNNLSLDLSGKSYKLAPRNHELNQFTVCLDDIPPDNISGDPAVAVQAENPASA